MLTCLRPALVMMALMSILTGFAYPFSMTAIATLVAPVAAKGSLIMRDGTVVGSSLIGQNFVAPGYFHPRPSASDWNAAATGASNLGPTSAVLVRAVQVRRAAYRKAFGVEAPIDAVTTSASGLDPDISPQNAMAQAASVARARGVAVQTVVNLIDATTQGRFLGLYGEPRINVLAVNLALDATLPASSPAVEN